MADADTPDILLVEDGDADAEMIARALRLRAGAGRLKRVRDGAEALDFVLKRGGFENRRGGAPKLILLDLKMPKLGGIEVLRRLKGADRTRTIPIVIFTSSAEQRDVVEAYRCGANSYLVKPVDAIAFREVLAQAGQYWLMLNHAPDGPGGPAPAQPETP